MKKAKLKKIGAHHLSSLKLIQSRHEKALCIHKSSGLVLDGLIFEENCDLKLMQYSRNNSVLELLGK